MTMKQRIRIAWISINRNIVECKWATLPSAAIPYPSVLIETLWNVNVVSLGLA